MRRLLAAAALAGAVAGCGPAAPGPGPADQGPPQNVWELADRAVARVPLTVAQLEALLGTALTPDPQNPRRWQGPAVQLAPQLRVSSSVTALSDHGGWLFAEIGIAAQPCVTLQAIREHYPAVVLRDGPHGHSAEEEARWAVSYGWGELGFGVRERDGCLTTLSLTPATTR